MSAITAKLNYLRMSPRKIRVVADAIRGMDVDHAQVQLDRLSRTAADPIKKLLNSAIASAIHNFQKNRANLFVQSITVDKGPVLKRFRARAFGRAADIRKHTSHIVLTLGELKTPAKKRFTIATKEKTKASGTLEEMSQGEKKKTDRDFTPGDKKDNSGIQKRVADIGKRIFRRKSV